MSKVRLLDLGDRALVNTYLRKFPPEVSELTFTNLFVWRGARPIWIVETEGALAFLTKAQPHDQDPTILFGPPLGDAPAFSLISQLDLHLTQMVRIPAAIAQPLAEKGLRIDLDRDNADYVYRVADLAELKGRLYHKKRNLISQCLGSYTCRYEEITPALIPECREMMTRWCKVRSCALDPGLCGESQAIEETFAHFQDFGLIGGAVRVNGIIEAFAMGETLSPAIAVCHFEKAMPQVHGLSQVINQWFAKYSLGSFEFVNREQDLGIPGLRQAKESYYPHHLAEKYRVIVSPAVSECPPLREPQECVRHGAMPD